LIELRAPPSFQEVQLVAWAQEIDIS